MHLLKFMTKITKLGCFLNRILVPSLFFVCFNFSLSQVKSRVKGRNLVVDHSTEKSDLSSLVFQFLVCKLYALLLSLMYTSGKL